MHLLPNGASSTYLRTTTAASANPAHNLSVRASALVPEIGEVLEHLVFTDNERGNRDRDGLPSLPVVAWDEGLPSVVGPFDEQAASLDFDFTECHSGTCCTVGGEWDYNAKP